MNSNEYDLLIRADRVVCPGQSMDGPGAVAVRGSNIVMLGPDIQGSARRHVYAPNTILLPGLIDMHAHPALNGSIFGIDPDRELLPMGTTTVLSQGDAGAANWKSFCDHTIDACRIRVRLAINLARFGESTSGGCFRHWSDVDVDACARAIEEDNGQRIWGIAVNTSRHACGTSDPREVMHCALAVAERTGKPILYGMRQPTDWSFADQMQQLRPGDVVTYCYRREPHCIVEHGRVHPAFHDAREQGVYFDVGHGMASFDFATAEMALADGFPPDTISTDYQARHRGLQPPHSLPRTMSKLAAAGMSEDDVLAAVTIRPATILGMQNEIGTLAPGSCADLTLLRWNEQAERLTDVYGVERRGGCWEAVHTVRGGQLISPSTSGD